MPKVSYIVSAYNRPASLPCCLWSLKVQTDPDFEVIVADNGLEIAHDIRHQLAVCNLNDPRFRRVDTSNSENPAWDSYWSAEIAVEHEACGEWLCFPSDDSYYMPIFQEALVKAAEERGWDLVYCDMIYDRRLSGKYATLDVQARVGQIDKTGFLLKREKWIGFPHKPTVPGFSCADGEMIAQLVASGVKHGKVSEILVVHN
jgi:glycosyltransferase involved in cell wall biosynthesis